MKFKTRRVSGAYSELTIDEPNATMSSGLLDYKESLNMAVKLISAAEDILPSDFNMQVELLTNIRESLGSNGGSS